MSFHPALALLGLIAPLPTAQSTSPPAQSAVQPAASISQKIAGMTHMDGLLPLDWDAKAGKLYLEIPHLNTDLLYVHSLPFGVGSNDLGLDRGQVSSGAIVRFERTGPKVLLIEPNELFRSSSSDNAERLAVRQSFPESVLFGFKVEAEDASGAVLVDATNFFMRDAHGVTETLADAKQGAYKPDVTRSTIALDRTRAFPENTEIESTLTFTTDDPGKANFVRQVTPDSHAVTVREHQSFIELPGPGFTPRRFDPRAGYFPDAYRDYSAALGEPLDQQFIIRHRLQKKDPACVRDCEAQAPIQYYVDRGAPEPVRTALVEGARWWDQAFQAAGWAPGTFRVELLPADADPMDIRYNIIQWVHRYTRGWSYGSAVVDPRTGEIIKGNVTLGSLRARQDYLIAEGLLSPYVDGKPLPAADDPMLAMVLARIRQLAAHETGHTLGLAHNFAASSYPHTPQESVSVMDYPFPYIALDGNGVPSLKQSYAVNIGIWDKVAINYGYREFDREGKLQEDAAALNEVLASSEKTGLIFITDEDARPLGGAHPHAHLWDNGADPADELNRILDIRAAGLKRFGVDAIRTGTPLAQLEDTLVPLYLLHRYQTEAAVKEIGGLDYRYQLRGDAQPNAEIVAPAEQNKALAAVLKTLSPQALTLPESLLAIMPPRPPGLRPTRESFPSETGLTFDPIAAAESAADLTLAGLLDPSRVSRIVQYHMRVPDSLSLRVVLEDISKATAERPEAGHTMSSEVARAVEFRALEAMLSLAVNQQASSQARAIARFHIDGVLKQLTSAQPLADTAEEIHRAAMIDRIQAFQKDPTKFVPSAPVNAPPGMPIGEGDDFSISPAS
jgi:hypothetical protein